MSVKLKFKVIEKTERQHWNSSAATIGGCKLSPVTSGSDENKAFYDSTPGGSIEFSTINKAALDSLPLGAEVYVTIEVAPKP